MASDANNGARPAIDFAADVLDVVGVTAHADDANVIISPFLLEAQLALLFLGSDGATAECLKRALRLDRYGSNAKMANHFAANLAAATGGADTALQLTSRIVLGERNAAAEEFRRIAQKYFHTETATIPRAADAAELRRHLSEVVAKLAPSGNSISDSLLRSDVAADASALLLAVASFRHKWFLPFSAYRTGLYEFHLNTAERKTVPMLFDDDMFVKFGEFKDLDARAIELPYEHDDEELAMLLLLPNRRDGLAALSAQMKSVDLSALMERMQLESVQVLLPRFRIDFECNLRECLENLGLSSIFSSGANFKNMLQEQPAEALRISNVIHKISLEVNESGSETSSVVVNKPIVISNSIDSRKKFFRADHPFYFAVVDGHRDVTYFVGSVSTF